MASKDNTSQSGTSVTGAQLLDKIKEHKPQFRNSFDAASLLIHLIMKKWS